MEIHIIEWPHKHSTALIEAPKRCFVPKLAVECKLKSFYFKSSRRLGLFIALHITITFYKYVLPLSAKLVHIPKLCQRPVRLVLQIQHKRRLLPHLGLGEIGISTQSAIAHTSFAISSLVLPDVVDAQRNTENDAKDEAHQHGQETGLVLWRLLVNKELWTDNVSGTVRQEHLIPTMSAFPLLWDSIGRTHHGIDGILLRKPAHIRGCYAQHEREVSGECKEQAVAEELRPDVLLRVDFARHNGTDQRNNEVPDQPGSAAVLDEGGAASSHEHVDDLEGRGNHANKESLVRGKPEALDDDRRKLFRVSKPASASPRQQTRAFRNTQEETHRRNTAIRNIPTQLNQHEQPALRILQRLPHLVALPLGAPDPRHVPLDPQHRLPPVAVALQEPRARRLVRNGPEQRHAPRQRERAEDQKHGLPRRDAAAVDVRHRVRENAPEQPRRHVAHEPRAVPQRLLAALVPHARHHAEARRDGGLAEAEEEARRHQPRRVRAGGHAHEHEGPGEDGRRERLADGKAHEQAGDRVRGREVAEVEDAAGPRVGLADQVQVGAQAEDGRVAHGLLVEELEHVGDGQDGEEAFLSC